MPSITKIREGFFGWFNTTFDHSVNHYTNSVGKILGSTGRYLLILCADCCRNGGVVLRLPSSFYLKSEIRVFFLTMIQLPLARRKSDAKVLIKRRITI
ncbi:hypothetical protein DMI70_10585 [Escherichia coli]|nr:hypothetical protein [Escherichia coli]